MTRQWTTPFRCGTAAALNRCDGPGIRSSFPAESTMTIALFEDRGTPLAQQRFTWRELAGKPISKLDDDAFTRVRVILMNGLENEALRFSHAAARFNGELRLPLAE